MKEIIREKSAPYALASRRILLTFIIVSFLPLSIITLSVLYQSNKFYHEKVRANLEYLVKFHTQNMDNFLKERLYDIRLLSATYTFPQLKNEDFLHKMLKIVQEESGSFVSDLGIIDEKGQQLAYAGPFRLEKADYSSAAWFKNAIATETYVSDVFLGLRGLPHFIVTVRKEWQGKPWLIRATIDFRAFNERVENLRVGKNGFAFIMNKDGEFQTDISKEVALGKAAYMNLFLTSQGSPKDGVRFIQSDAVTGVNTIYAAAQLKDGNWFMILQETSADAFADLRKTQGAAFLNFMIGGVAIIAAGIVLSRLVARRLTQANQEKEMMNQQIIETGKLASLGELAAGIAHEINNPVAIMVEEAGWIGDLLSDESFPETENLTEFKRALAQINKQGIRCRDITQKLLSFARKSEIHQSVVQINEVIQEVVEISHQHARYNNVAIETQYTNDLPMIEVSQTEIQQVMLNLINNALDAMEKEGGKIEIATGYEKGEILIRVSDNGPGIPETNIARIFDPFYTTKPVGKGTGLGLSICYGIISRMGGKIKVKSAVGVGTSFYIYLPAEEQNETYTPDLSSRI